MGIAYDAQRPDPGELLQLFTLDATEIGGDVLRFHPHKMGDVSFGGDVYTRFPIKAEGFERTSRGPAPRPTLTASNIGSVLSAVLRITDDLRGAKLTRLRTFKRYLDGEPDEDPTQFFPADIYYVNRKVSEDAEYVVFELATPYEASGIGLPRRSLVANSCPWVYRGGVGAGCPYAGAPVTRADGTAFTGTLRDQEAWEEGHSYSPGDYVYVMVGGVRQYYVQISGSSTTQPLTNGAVWAADRCTKTLAACKAHFGETAPLPFGGFPSCGRIPR